LYWKATGLTSRFTLYFIAHPYLDVPDPSRYPMGVSMFYNPNN
jgi:hypothetical protein